MTIEEHRVEATRMLEDLDPDTRALIGDFWLVSTVSNMLTTGDKIRVDGIGRLDATFCSWPTMVAVAIAPSGRLSAYAREVELSDPTNSAMPWAVKAPGFDYPAAYHACARVAGEAARAAAQADIDLDPDPVA